MTRERVRPSLLTALSEPCEHCNGLGRVLSKYTMATKIERWFQRAKAEGDGNKYNLIVNPALADFLTNGEGNRIARMANVYHFHINLVRDTTISLQKFIVTDVESGSNLTEEHDS